MVSDWLARFLWRYPFAVDALKNCFLNSGFLNCKLYRIFTLKRARGFAQKYPDGKIGLAIETTVDCNSKCVMCYHNLKKINGTMSMALFEKIINDCSNNGIRSVSLCVYGEPLMDRYFFERVEYLRKHGMSYSFFTNGFLLDQEKARRLLELGGLEFINFSICGYDRGVYESTMVNLKRDTVYNNVMNFIGLKMRLKLKAPLISISNVKTDLTMKDMKEYLRFWRRQKGIDGMIIFDLWDRLGESDITKIGRPGKMHTGNYWLAPCAQLWNMFCIYFDGRVAPCCYDADLRELIIGDMNKQSISDINMGAEIKKLRNLHLADRRMSHDVCGKCPTNSLWF